ncbi:DUF397 domain-containing protein [Streptomyces triticirhizae]|uniref:DUF397 domain-containing protein n=1 Tax=Streptomyces triticirhizae TaxID=2483353 RepID=A0A3M2LTY5_9ACTN|nr:DUF397 domain-containing protein [Streptomyces triticirhizae]RMI40857.1 DUF397 domain-containing protein [Streptomyces triticirhizae]
MSRAELMDDKRWFTSSYSNGTGNCVEVADLDGAVGLRDTKDREAGVVTVGVTQWRTFLAAAEELYRHQP